MFAPLAGRTPEQEALTRALYEKTQAAYAAIPPHDDSFSKEYVEKQIVPLIEWYFAARKAKTFVVADVLRAALEARGVEIKTLTEENYRHPEKGGFYISRFLETTEYRLKRLYPAYYKEWKKTHAR